MLYDHSLPIKLLSSIIIFIVAVVAGIYPFIKKITSQREYGFTSAEALAAGVFLGAGLLHMLGDSAQDFIMLRYQYPLPFLLAGVTFLWLLWLEHLSDALQKARHANHPMLAILAVFMLSIHSFLAGAALGLGGAPSVILMIMVAILAHKWAASFALAIHLNKSSLPLRMSLLLFGLFALMTPLGIYCGDLTTRELQSLPLLQPIFTALSAGTFIYLGTLHGLNRSVMVKECCNLRQYTFVLLGFSLMAVVAIWT